MSSLAKKKVQKNVSKKSAKLVTLSFGSNPSNSSYIESCREGVKKLEEIVLFDKMQISSLAVSSQASLQMALCIKAEVYNYILRMERLLCTAVAALKGKNFGMAKLIEIESSCLVNTGIAKQVALSGIVFACQGASMAAQKLADASSLIVSQARMLDGNIKEISDSLMLLDELKTSVRIIENEAILSSGQAMAVQANYSSILSCSNEVETLLGKLESLNNNVVATVTASMMG